MKRGFFETPGKQTLTQIQYHKGIIANRHVHTRLSSSNRFINARISLYLKPNCVVPSDMTNSEVFTTPTKNRIGSKGVKDICLYLLRLRCFKHMYRIQQKNLRPENKNRSRLKNKARAIYESKEEVDALAQTKYASLIRQV